MSYNYQPVDPSSLLDKMMTLDKAKELLAPTEGLREYEFVTDGQENVLHFDFPDKWNDGLREKDDFAVTEASVDIDGTEIALTKNGALELASAIGLQKSYVERTPGVYIGPQLDHHYSHGANGKKRLKLLSGNSGVFGVTRGTVTPFSNYSLLDSVAEGVKRRYETEEILVDYKFNHNFQNTNMRLVVPSATRNIGSARAERAGDDPWMVGIEIANSIEGSSSLELNGYLFALWCTNGAIMERASSGKYRRKPTLSPEDAYEWATMVTDDVFADLDREFDAVEQLTNIPLEGELNETVGRMFERFNVPVDTRELVLHNLVESDDLTAYGLMNAVTAAANSDELSPNAVRALLLAGGDVAHVLSDRCDVCHRF